MASDGTVQPEDVKREHLGHLLSNLLTPLLMFVVLPALGLLGFFLFDAAGFDLRGSFSAKPNEGLQISGVVTLLLLATGAFLAVSGFFFAREIYRWLRPAK